ncbi:hypothetical protein CDZ98_09020 [Mameliella alba]|nr:hypothetical protein CDZ98_09020 [Mameliella alba]
MILRDDTMPLVVCAALLGLSTEVPLSERVVIIVIDADRKCLLGLVVNALQGMISQDRSRRAEMGIVGHGPMLAGAQSFVRDGAVVSILDPPLLFDQPSLAFAVQQDRSCAPLETGASGQSGYLLCGYQDFGLAFPLSDIHATIPMIPLQDSPLAHGPCDGVIHHHGTEIPILDSLQLFGLGGNFSRPESSAAVALRAPGGGLVAFEIDRFFDIVHTRTEDLLDVPRVISGRSDLFSGIHMDETGKHYLVIDSPRLPREEVVVQLSSTTVNDTPDTPDDAAPGYGGPVAPYLLCRSAGNQIGCHLTDIVEILRLPGDLLRGEARHDGYLGTLSHRAQLIPVFSIASLLGTTTRIEEGNACVLLFREGRQLFGAVVDALEEVARCQPFGPPEEKMLRRPETGAFVPLFDLQTEIAITALDTGIALP